LVTENIGLLLFLTQKKNLSPALVVTFAVVWLCFSLVRTSQPFEPTENGDLNFQQ